MNNVPQIFNRKKILLHRQRASHSIKKHNFLINEVSGRILERLDDMSRQFPSVLTISNSSYLSEHLVKKIGVNLLVNQDLSFAMLQKTTGLKVVADEETMPFAKSSFDLIISNLSLHLTNDLPGALVQINQILKPDGLFIASLYGLETLNELRQVMATIETEKTGGISPRISPFADVKTLGSLIQRTGYALPVADSEIIKVSYSNALELMHDLRGMGESNALIKTGRPLTRELISAIDSTYKQQFSDGEGGIIATFEIINITGLAANSNK
ncbi:MAG: putative SAM-dependent methyltransferase [Rickettsiaceae bacterium]|jgi:SAM-dependent methyltransferase|nr:putative SAM-dependent methyltransferase [Rickettsiaceae bacterium]